MTDSGSIPGVGQAVQKELPEIDPLERRRSRIKLVMVFLIFAVPLLLASIYLHMVRSSGGAVGDTSRGQLIHPAVPLEDFQLLHDGENFTVDDLRGIWTLLYLPAGECLDACRQNLYHMKQVRLALNHRMTRVQRVLLLESEPQLPSSLLADHPGLISITGTASAQETLRNQIMLAQAAMTAIPDAIYLIDPLGNLMLRFPPDLEPQKMLKDLKHLLKVSRIG